jgi:hypothetical protein
MNEPQRVLIVESDTLFPVGADKSKILKDRVWVDRVSGGLLSQFLRRQAERPNAKKHSQDLFWIRLQDGKYRNIFIVPKNNEAPLKEICDALGPKGVLSCDWVGELNPDLEKKMKKFFSEVVKVDAPKPWSEDL